MKITDRIKSFADVLAYHNINEEQFGVQTKDLAPDEVAYKQLKLIVSAFNEGWAPDWNTYSERKWMPWFDMEGGFSFDLAGCGLAYSCVGSRLCFKSEELVEYAVETFFDIYKAFFTL